MVLISAGGVAHYSPPTFEGNIYSRFDFCPKKEMIFILIAYSHDNENVRNQFVAWHAIEPSFYSI